jgi:hypothetical protein
MKQLSSIIWSLLLLLILNGCNLDGLDFNKLSNEVNLNPSLVAPVATANITGWDLFKSPNKEKGPTGLVNLVYRENDILKYNIRDLVTLPTEQKFSSIENALGEITPGDVSISKNLPLSELISTLNSGLEAIIPYDGMTVPFPAYSFLGPEVKFDLLEINDFTSILVSGGTLEITLENKLKVPVTIKGSLFDAGNNRKVTDFTFANVPPEGFSKTSVSLAGILFSNKVEFHMLSFETVGSATPVNINLADYLRITFSLKNMKISKGNIMVTPQAIKGTSGAFGFVFPEPEMKAFTAILKSGILTVRTTNSTKLSGNIDLSLNEIKKKGTMVQANIPINGSSTIIDLSGAEINFSSNPLIPYNQIPYTYSVYLEKSNGYIDFSSTDALKVDITLTNLDFQSFSGDFGKRKVQIDPGNFEMSVLNRLGGDFKVSNPKLSLILHNSFGIPAEVSVNMNASNKLGQTDDLIRNPTVFDIPVPADVHSGIVSESIDYTNKNSNIVEFIGLPPNSMIRYNGEINFNKKNGVTALRPNFFTSESSFTVDMALELPMELQISTLSFADTSGISGENFDKLESAELVINAKNGIPFDLDVQLSFIDTISKVQYGTTKKTKILLAAKVNSSGEYVPSESSQAFGLDKSEMDNLKKANGVVFTGTVISPSGENVVVNIMTTSKIELGVVIKSKLNL